MNYNHLFDHNRAYNPDCVIRRSIIKVTGDTDADARLTLLNHDRHLCN